MAGNTSTSFFLAFLMATVSAQAFDWRSLVQRKTHVVIVNDLPGGAQLSFRCHSNTEDGDLGHYTLNKGGTKEISFYASLWSGVVIVTCDFNWGRNHHHSFNVFDEDHDTYRCAETCRLHIEPRGPFYYVDVVIEKNVHSYKSIWLKVPLSWK